MSTATENTTTGKRQIGQVKWFNNKAGYGFITMKDEDGTDCDIFTHYSTVQVADTQYKYLVQGEYVEFELVDSANENHKYQATNVTGIKGGKLMCETRQQNRTTYTTRRPPRREDDGEFTKVQRKRNIRKKDD
jgi:cold shock CspA family protein